MARPMDHPLSPALTIWYDGGCPLCLREIALMRRLDTKQRIHFVDVAGDAPCPLDRRLMLARFHATLPDGTNLSGAAAFAAMWREIPLLRPLGLIARNKIVLRGLERAYLLFLKIRPALQRLAR